MLRNEAPIISVCPTEVNMHRIVQLHQRHNRYPVQGLAGHVLILRWVIVLARDHQTLANG
jgi:hypothetical protein